jgi:di/tricarboxylate transporter
MRIITNRFPSILQKNYIHKCNALIMGPGGYQVKDFMKAGGIMTVIFLIVSLVMLNIVF